MKKVRFATLSDGTLKNILNDKDSDNNMVCHPKVGSFYWYFINNGTCSLIDVDQSYEPNLNTSTHKR